MYRENVIKGLEICVNRIPGKYTCHGCPYEKDGIYCEINLTKDALALLKEQRAEISKISSAYLDLVGKASKQPEIVRCKDCKHMEDDGSISPLIWCSIHEFGRMNDYFCADAIRKDWEVPE